MKNRCTSPFDHGPAWGALTLLLAWAGPVSLAQDGTPENYAMATDANGYLNYIAPDGAQVYMGLLPASGPYGRQYNHGGGALGDLDGDGDLDWVIAGGYYGGDVFLFEKTGPGMSFAMTRSSWSGGYYPGDIEVGDFNEDGRLDFVFAHYGSSAATIYINVGDMLFQRSYVPGLTPTYGMDLAVADFNGDGHLDLAAPSWGQSQLYISLGDGTGAFTPTWLMTSPFALYWVAAGDFDEDGHADLLAPHPTVGYMALWRGHGDGTFSYTVVQGGSVTPVQPVEATDFDGDGHLDFVGVYQYYVRFWRGLGDGTFSYVRTAPGGAGSYRYGLAVPPAVRLRRFRTDLLEAQTGIVSVLGGAAAGALPGVGVYFARLIHDGYQGLDPQTLTASPEFVSIQEVLSPTPGTLEVLLSVPPTTPPGDYPLHFSAVVGSGEVVETQNEVTLTVIDPLEAAGAIYDALVLQVHSADKPSFVARINSQVIGPLGQIQEQLTALYDEGFTDQAQQLLEDIVACRELADALINGSSPSDTAHVQACLDQAITAYGNQILPGLADMATTTSPGGFNSLLMALEGAAASLQQARESAHEALAESISALIADTETLELCVHGYAEAMLGTTESQELHEPSSSSHYVPDILPEG